MTDTLAVLPPPVAERWRPARAGLVSLWRYWDETFSFHRGRLLLRGPNGSGKSMALELLLPFLLDADASPNRLSSAAKSRGGLFERVMTGTTEAGRAGFAWVEFRRDEATFTVGVRVRASAATRKVDLDFFTTWLAVGSELHLLDDQRVPLSRKALIEALGHRGHLHASAEEHRSAVREVLFPGFGPDRYQSVITALLALRKEKLSTNLDIDKLSEVLSEALPPVDEHDLAVVAEGFERLDRRRQELDALETEVAEVKMLRARQRDYARAVVASVAAGVRSTESQRDAVTRSEREAADHLDAARQEGETMEAETTALASRLGALTTEIAALKESDAYRDGAALTDLRSEARRLEQLVERDRRNAGRLAEEEARRRHGLDDASAERQATAERAALAADEMAESASSVAAEAMVGEAASIDPDEGEALIESWIRARRQLVEEVRAALEAHGLAVERRRFAEAAVQADETTVEDRSRARRQALARHQEAVATYAEAVGTWASSCAAVGPERVGAVLPTPSEDAEAVEAAVSELRTELGAEMAVWRRDLAASVQAMSDERSVLARERSRLAEGRLVEPETPGWRSDRSERVGAPLWRLVDVADGVSSSHLDGIEAGLLACGLLDAWLAPDGTLELPEEVADLVLGARPAPGHTLADLLVPLEDSPVGAGVVASVLASVPVAPTALTGSWAPPSSEPTVPPGQADAPDHADAPGHADGGELVVALDGSFRIGPAAGRGSLRPAELLGAAAQERRRLARMAELDSAMAGVDARLEDLERRRSELDVMETARAADLDAAPDTSQLDAALREVTGAEARLGEAGDRLAADRRELANAEAVVRQALRSLSALGSRHGLPTTAEALDEVVRRLERLRSSAGRWARRVRELAHGERFLRRAADDAERAAADAERAAAALGESESDAAGVRVKVATLESAIGAEYQSLLDRIARLDEERSAGLGRERELARARPPLERRIGALEAELRQAELARVRADEERDRAHRRFAAAMADGLAAQAGLGGRPRTERAEMTAGTAPLEGVTAVLTAARSLSSELDGVTGDDRDLERTSARVEERLHHARAALGPRMNLERQLGDHGWWVLRAFSAGARRSASELAEAMTAELEESRAELAADEERLFEQTLAGSVRYALAERIRLANQLVDGINRQAGAVRTAAGGVAVKLRWEVDPDQPEAVRAARSLLLRDPAGLSETERDSLQAFVRARVDQARTDLEVNASWEARLRETLDYRAWHRFSLLLAHRDWEGYQPATTRRLQRLSTGERSIALHLPMLASIAAHYADEHGNPSDCPRLILLDELFAGVDATNRAQLFGTFTAWDLDAVFTSDHEWCQYASLDGIAIHHLHPAVGDEPVTSTRFTWDGRRRAIDPPAA